MNNAPAILKSLVIYALCVPLAVIVGYMLTDPLDYTTFAYAGVLGLGLFSPLLFRWHYPLLLFSLNTTAILFFIKGRPAFWLVMVALSLGMSLLERAMNSQKRFIRVPQITWPLIYMIGVVLFTAKLTGGIGLHAFGSEVYGGKKYFFLVMSILSYFAFTAQRIPPERVNLYVALLLLGGVTWFIGDMYPITPAFLHFIFWMFPPTSASVETIELGVTSGWCWLRSIGLRFLVGGQIRTARDFSFRQTVAAGFVYHGIADDFFGWIPHSDYNISRHLRVAVFSGKIAPDTGAADFCDDRDTGHFSNHPVLLPFALYVSTGAGVFAIEFEHRSQRFGQGQFGVARQYVESAAPTNPTIPSPGQRVRHYHGRF